MDKLRVIELFAGIGAQASALERLGIPFESTVCEIEERPYRMYCAIHGDTPNLGDITKVEHLPECDLLTYSSPCQDISIAGSQRGLVEGSGTRSSLIWEVGRLLKDMREREVPLPEVLLMENVDAILNKKNISDFKAWIKLLDDLGYCSSYEVLNAKNYGIPQNRRRCFMVSTLHKGQFVFPPKIPLDKRLKDVLEDDVPESYFLSSDRIATFERHKSRQIENGNGFFYKPFDPERERDHPASTVTSKPDRYCSTWVKIPKSESSEGSEGEREVKVMPTIEVVGNLNTPGRFEQCNRVYGVNGPSPTVATGSAGGDHIPKIDVSEEDSA